VKNQEITYLFGINPRVYPLFEEFIAIITSQIELGTRIKLVLIHDGVIGSSEDEEIPSLIMKLSTLDIEMYGMVPDIIARGINRNKMRERIKSLTYEELVDILATTEKIISYL
jgi:sulfur relay protein TusB/DsrH